MIWIAVLSVLASVIGAGALGFGVWWVVGRFGNYYDAGFLGMGVDPNCACPLCNDTERRFLGPQAYENDGPIRKDP